MRVASKASIPLVAGLFLAPIIGGQIFVDALRLEPNAGIFELVMKGAPETPWLSHAYLAVFLLATAVVMAFTQKVIALPKIGMSALMLFFGGCLVASLSGSSFKMISAAAISEWLIYIAAFFIAAAAAGRSRNSIVLIGAIVAGCAIVSIMGILEYGQMRRFDPTWRIFASWVNSNALAGMLLIGLMLGLGLTSTRQGLTSLLSGFASSLIGLALLLTQSRGAILYALPAGSIILFAGVAGAKGTARDRFSRTAKLILPPIGVAVLMTALMITTPKSAGGSVAPSALTRVSTQADHAREQSSSFRIMLWKSSIELMRKNPSGYGLGTFRFEGSRSGLIVPTQLAHQTFLQLGSEASPIAPAVLLTAGLLWLFHMFGGFGKTPFELSAVRMAIVAAVAASFVHNLFDSDLYYFGIGLTFFALLGIGLSLAADGVSPEYLPTPIRISFPVWILFLAAALAFAGVSKLRLSQGLTALSEGDIDAGRQLFERSADNGMDAEAFFLLAKVEKDGEKRLSLLRKAAQLNPSPKFYRALAREQAMAGKTYEAIESFSLALKRDPNNLQTLRQLLDLYLALNDKAKARETAERMVAVEKSPSFTIRAISEAVPVQTFEARIYLASQEKNKRKVIELLKPAVEGYQEYVRNTVPRVIQNSRSADDLTFAGESVDTALQAVDAGRTAARNLINAYRMLGDRAGAADSVKALDEFEAAADSLRSISK